MQLKEQRKRRKLAKERQRSLNFDRFVVFTSLHQGFLGVQWRPALPGHPALDSTFTPESPYDSRRSAADSPCACTGTTGRWSAPRTRISPAAAPCPCGCHHKTAGARKARTSTRNERRPQPQEATAWCRKRAVLPPCDHLGKTPAGWRELTRKWRPAVARPWRSPHFCRIAASQPSPTLAPSPFHTAGSARPAHPL